jgi:hypothetical protein
LVRLGTGAALAGLVAGVWNVWAYLQECRGPVCPAFQAAPPGTEGTAVLVMAVILVLGSLATFLTPASLFYLTASLGLLIDAIEVLNYSVIGAGSFYVTMILVTLSVALSILAATRRAVVSEQSHPMNLPVFG